MGGRQHGSGQYRVAGLMNAVPRWSAVLIWLTLQPVSVPAAELPAPAEDCAAIRARIGVVPAADPVLLRTLAERRDCAFTAAEVYRAAHGDKPPVPASSRHEGRDHHHHHDDD